MKRLILFTLSLVVGIVLFSGVIGTIGWEELWNAARSFSPVHVVVIAALTILMLAAGMLRWQAILQNKGYTLSWTTLLRYYLAGYAIIFFVPVLAFGGEFFRAYAVKTKEDKPVAPAIASVVIERIIEVTTHFITIVGALVVLFLQADLAWSRFIGFLILGLVLFGAVIVWFYRRTLRGERVLYLFLPKKFKNGNIRDVEKEVVSFFSYDNPYLKKAFAYSLLRTGISFVRVWLLAVLLIGYFPLLYALPVLGFSYLALLIPIPGSLGSHDALQAFVFQAFGMKASFGAVFALALRVSEMTIALMGALLLLFISIELFRNQVLERAERFSVRIKRMVP